MNFQYRAQSPATWVRTLVGLAVVSVAFLSTGCSLHREASGSVTGLTLPKDDYQALSYKALPVGKKVRLVVDRYDPSMAFEGGKSFVEALALPDIPTPYRIDLQSVVQAQGDGEDVHVLLPSLTFLDADKQLIQTVNDLRAEYRSHTLRRPILRAAVTLDNTMAHARYMLIHTDPNSLDDAMSIDDSATRLKSSGFRSMLYAPVTKARYRVDFGREGVVTVQVRPHQSLRSKRR